MIRHGAILLLLGSVLLLLAACGEGPSGVTPIGGPPVLAGGGIGGSGDGGASGVSSVGGTSKGTVTGYDGIVLNEDRHFTLTPETAIEFDGMALGAAELQALGTGFIARVLLAEDVNASVSTGTAVSVRIDHYLTGPVTAVSPQLEVLGQPVETDAGTSSGSSSDSTTVDATMLVGVHDVDALDPQQVVRVSGYPDLKNRVLATRLELVPGGTPLWTLTGPVSRLVPGVSFSIGPQVVNLAGVEPTGCSDGLHDGRLVRVDATADPGFVPGDVLDTVVRVSCMHAGLEVPTDAGEPLAAVIEGLVGMVALPSFNVDGQAVLVTPDTVFQLGGPEDIFFGTKVEVQGRLDPHTGLLTADRIRFRDLKIHIRAPLYPEDVKIGEHLEIMGIRVFRNDQTRDTRGILAGAFTTPAQVDVTGYLDVDGRVYASSIRQSGALSSTKVELRGPVEWVNAPARFGVLDVEIDASHTSQFEDGEGNGMSRQAFFAALKVDASVEVLGGTYDGSHGISSASRIILWSKTGSQGSGNQDGDQ